MRLTSLRSKIFLLVGLTLAASAIVVLLITEHNVTRTVIASEKQSVQNVLNLLRRDSEGRWGDWLNNKITTVRNDRTQLVQSGNIISSVLNLYANQVKQHEYSRKQAQKLARQWINNLHIGSGQHSFIFDHNLRVIASDQATLRGVNLAGMKDFKGHDLAATAYREARTTGHSFAIYHRGEKKKEKQGELRYAYFVYFEPWNWVFAVSGNARDVIQQLQARRKEMKQSISQALQHTRLAQSGFVFIAADNGHFVSPPPGKHAGMLGWHGADNNKTLHDILKNIPPGGHISAFQFTDNKTDVPWIISATYFKPLGWTIVAAVPKADLTSAASALRNRLILVFLLALLVSLATAWIWSMRLTRPFRDLTRFARKLPEQDLNAPADIPEHIQNLPQTHPDEVGRLAETFIYMDQQLREKIASLVRETSSRERFESELNIARAIQMGLLPVPLSPETQRKVNLHASITPAKQVGGDLYDYFLLSDGRLCLAIGDVSGKGVPAALFMAITRTLIRASAEDESDPALMMKRINSRLSENNPNVMFVTLIVAVLDLETGKLTWANAGHPPPCIVDTKGHVRLLEGVSGPACGVIEGDQPYRLLSSELASGEVLVGYTDGVTEAHDPVSEQYGEARLYALLGDRAESSAQDVAAALLHDVQQFVRGAEQFDDITVVTVKRVVS